MARLDAPVSLPQARGFGQTMRNDNWWVQPLLVFLGFSAFIVYSTWAALQGRYYFVPGTNYLSPMYSPVLFDAPGQHSGHAWFGSWPSSGPLAWMPLAFMTPAFLILWAPGGFRFTCYYYRGAYYKAFWADPIACSIGEPRKSYLGERYLPLILQNIHRYFLYLAILFIGLLSFDAIESYFFHDPLTNATRFGIGIGTLVLTINPILLGSYTFGCHSLRHLVGGGIDQLSRHPGRKKTYDCVSCLNRRHMVWAWLSLFWVGFTDVYVRMVASGHWHDLRIF
jgi:hypothetical protein